MLWGYGRRLISLEYRRHVKLQRSPLLHFTSAYSLGKYTRESIMKSPPNSANTRQRARPSSDVTLLSPDYKEDDRGALAGADGFSQGSHCPISKPPTVSPSLSRRGSQRTAHCEILLFTSAPAVQIYPHLPISWRSLLAGGRGVVAGDGSASFGRWWCRLSSMWRIPNGVTHFQHFMKLRSIEKRQ